MNDSRVRKIACLMAIAGALVPAVSACGSDDDSGDGGSSAAPAQSADERQVEAVFVEMRQALRDSDAKVACGLMSAKGKREFATLSGGSCERGFTTVFDEGVSEDLNPRLADVKVNGNRAVVAARAKTSKGLQHAQFVKVDGDWKVDVWLRD